MERHVLELFRPELEEEIRDLVGAQAQSGPGGDGDGKGDGDGQGRGAGFRREASSQRILYYANEAETLQRISQKLKPGQYFLRPANLEDLFLKTTGRHLNEAQ